MKIKHRIFIVDDHRIFREGLAFLVSNMNDYEFAGEASDGKEFLETFDNNAELVLMDIVMPVMDGIEATSRALEKFPGLRIVAMTMFSEKEYLNRMISAGACGYLLKDSGKDEMERALSAAISGEHYYSQKVLNNLIVSSRNNKNFQVYTGKLDILLTTAESEILKMICQGLSTTQISCKLSMSFRSIEKCKEELLSKTGSRNVINLAVFAVKNHLVEI
jgi:DNA-binding NarL/FixJ family response regulator